MTPLPRLHAALAFAGACASLLAFAQPASADSYCIPGTPVCATETQNGVKVGAPKVSTGASTSGTVQGSAGGGVSGQFQPPTVQGSVGGGAVVATPTLDLSWLFQGAAQVAGSVSGDLGGNANVGVQVEPPPPPPPVWARGGGWYDPVYQPDWGLSACGGVQVTTSFIGPVACLGVQVFPTRWLSIDNEVFYAYGDSNDQSVAHANLDRHSAMYQPSVAFHAQADIVRLTGRIGATLEIAGVSRDADPCATLTEPGVTTTLDALCAPLDAVSEARAYAGAMTGVSFGLARDFVFMFDFRFVAKARIDAGDRDEPLDRAELGGLIMVRIGGESASTVQRSAQR